jgi:SAM-dependent methyltransferase
VPPRDRDAWVDAALGLGPPPDDGPALPRGCVPYLPCGIDALVRVIDAAAIGASDVFVDVGSGVGRAAAVVALTTGASAIGLEVQPALVSAARELASRVRLERVAFLESDAELPPPAMLGTVFFFYCPFGGERLARVLAQLAAIARPYFVACVDMPALEYDWLDPISNDGDLAVYRARDR